MERFGLELTEWLEEGMSVFDGGDAHETEK